MSEARPVLVERRRGERRKQVGIDIEGFIGRCQADRIEVQIQTQREFIRGQILAEDDTAVLVRCLNQDILLFRHGVVSIAAPKRI